MKTVAEGCLGAVDYIERKGMRREAQWRGPAITRIVGAALEPTGRTYAGQERACDAQHWIMRAIRVLHPGTGAVRVCRWETPSWRGAPRTVGQVVDVLDLAATLSLVSDAALESFGAGAPVTLPKG